MALIVATNERDLSKINVALQQLAQGRSNAVGSVTLTTSTTTTTVTNQTCGADSVIILSPTTANAASAVTTTYVSAVGPGTFTITHASSADTDLTFGYVNIG